MLSDFPDDLLERQSHRPWPVPSAPWMMTQTWNDVLFAHWPIDRDLLRPKVPAGFEIDLYENTAWLGITPFHITNAAPRGVPSLPWVSAFPEVNVRTYVCVNGQPGVYFFSLDAGSTLAVIGARALLNLPYFVADMEVKVGEPRINYESRREDGRDARLAIEYWPEGSAQRPIPGSIEYFLTERYCLHAVDASFRAYTIEIHHPPWSLQPAKALITENTMAEASDLSCPGTAPQLHFAKRQDTLIWPPHSR
jgi:uncharacterized protein YqjF (DUF2071 family)